MNLAGSIDVHGYCINHQNVANGFQGVIIINDDEIDSGESEKRAVHYLQEDFR